MLIRNEKSLLFIAVLFALFSCGKVVDRDGSIDKSFVVTLHDRETIIQAFSRESSSYFNSQDACLFKLFINDLFDSVPKHTIIADSLIFFHGYDPLTMFSFSLVKGIDQEKWQYYGLNDVYQARFFIDSLYSQGVPRVVELNSDLLNQLMKNIGILSGNADYPDRQRLNRFLFYLYQDRGQFSYYAPIFKRVLDKSELSVLAGSVVQDSTLQRLLETDLHQILVFELDSKALIVFTISASGTLREYLIPPVLPSAERYFKSDIIPVEYLKNCQ
jgi:hypothetical protein